MLYNNEGPIGAVYYSPKSQEAEFILMNVLTVHQENQEYVFPVFWVLRKTKKTQKTKDQLSLQSKVHFLSETCLSFLESGLS